MRKNHKKIQTLFVIGQLFKFKLSHKTWTLGAGFGYSSSRHCLLEAATGMKIFKRDNKNYIFTETAVKVFRCENFCHQVKNC